VEEHGGRIWTDGDALHTRFSFSLPIPEAALRRSETRIVAQSASASHRDEEAERALPIQGVATCSSN
jgi:hypothetical protein